MVVIHEPFERRPSIDDVAVGLRRNAGQLHVLVHDQGIPQFLVCEAHAAIPQPVVARPKFATRGGHHFKRRFREAVVLVPEVEFRQIRPRPREHAKVRGEGDARQALGEIVGEALAVARRVQDAVDVVEDGVLGDRGVRVLGPESLQGRIRDVVNAFGLVPLGEEVRVVKDTPLDGRIPTLGNIVRMR